MKKSEKPKFFTTPIWGNISIVLSVLLCFAFSKYITDVLFIVIITGLILIFLLWNLIKYIISWHKFYKEYEDLYESSSVLENRYTTRIAEIKNRDALIKEYEDFINDLNIFIITALTRNSATETKQLKNMQEFLYLSNEHFNRLKGGQ